LYRWQFDIRVSQHVLDEAYRGDPNAVRERKKVLKSLEKVEPKPGADELAGKLKRGCGLTESNDMDARHVTVAAMHALEFLLTWNCKHLANEVLRPKMMHICRKAGYDCPRIVTPDEIMRLRTHAYPRN